MAALVPQKWLNTGTAIGLSVALLIVLALALWVRFGPAVFLEMMASAWQFCF